MTTKTCFRLAAILSLTLPVALLPGCARPQQLTQITLQPSGTLTFGAADPALFANFKAIGTYEHPPQTKDITNQVTWVSSSPQLIAVTTSGAVSPAGLACGTGVVYAQMHQDGNDVVSDSITVTINGPTSSGCTPAGGTPVLTVSFGGSGLGQVTSSPAGITCTGPSACSATFLAGTTVTLTETPLGSSVFGGWTSNCIAVTATSCSILVETSNTTVTATFN